MHLPGISDRLLEAPTPYESIGPNRDEIMVALLARIGLVQRRQREVGSWVIDEGPLAEGDGWQDWPAVHRVATTDRFVAWPRRRTCLLSIGSSISFE